MYDIHVLEMKYRRFHNNNEVIPKIKMSDVLLLFQVNFLLFPTVSLVFIFLFVYFFFRGEAHLNNKDIRYHPNKRSRHESTLSFVRQGGIKIV